MLSSNHVTVTATYANASHIAPLLVDVDGGGMNQDRNPTVCARGNGNGNGNGNDIDLISSIGQ